MGSLKKYGAVVASAALVIGVAACGSSDSGSGSSDNDVVSRKSGEGYQPYIDRLYAAAKKEGEITYYQTSGESELKHIQDQWKQLFPDVELKPVTARTGSISQRALTEARAGKVQGDVLTGAVEDLVPLEDAGILQPYDAAGKENLPEAYRYDGPYVADFFLTRNVAYNTKNVSASELPTDWQGYCDPKWKGRLTIDPASYGDIAAWLQAWGEDRTTQFLECLSKNDVRVIEGTTASTQQLAAGEVDVKLDGMGHITKKFEDGGSPVTSQVPNPDPLPVIVGLSTILKGSPHPNGARLFQEFMTMSDGGQKAEALEGKPVLGVDLLSPEGPYPDYMKGSKPLVLEPNPKTAELISQGIELMDKYFVAGR